MMYTVVFNVIKYSTTLSKIKRKTIFSKKFLQKSLLPFATVNLMKSCKIEIHLKTSIYILHPIHFRWRIQIKLSSVDKQIAAREFGIAREVDAKFAETGFVAGSRKMGNVHLTTG